MKKITCILLFVMLCSTIFAFNASADIGPKPSITVVATNMPNMTCYLDLLIKDTVFDDRNVDYKKYDSALLNKLKSYSVDGWGAEFFLKDGFLLFGDIKTQIVNGKCTNEFSYFGIPDLYKIIIVSADGKIVVTNEIKHESFQSTVYIDYKQIKPFVETTNATKTTTTSPATTTTQHSASTADTTTVSASATASITTTPPTVNDTISYTAAPLTEQADVAKYSDVKEHSPILSDILQFLFTCVLTLLIEGLILVLFKFSLKQNWKPFLIINVSTQILLSLIVSYSTVKLGVIMAMLAYFIFEIVIFVAEALLFAKFIKGHTKLRRVICSLVSNAVSFGVGLLILFFMSGL